MEVLAPLAARYVGWLRLPAARTSDTSDEDPAQVRAMPVVLRVERATPPERTPLLEAAASAAVAVCLDPRAGAGGEWRDAVASWIGGRIRKVSRRARGAHWAAVQELPGITVAVPSGTGVAEVRALVPGLVTEEPKEVSRLQIAGTDLPADTPGPLVEGRPVVWLNPAVELTVGKAAAQVGHASMILAASLPAADLAGWYAGGLRCAVRVASESHWRAVLDAADGGRSTVLVRDAGFTEVAPGTVTCAAQWLPA
ncbi:MAG TPA: peptidyl-tRNA hydrolase [Pseudonocardia sp.]|nr:peptidyl-tRNA hydrolase [Pseudonocardia sp.]